MEEKIESKELGNYLKRVSSVHGMSVHFIADVSFGVVQWFCWKLISLVNQGGGDGKTGIKE